MVFNTSARFESTSENASPNSSESTLESKTYLPPSDLHGSAKRVLSILLLLLKYLKVEELDLMRYFVPKGEPLLPYNTLRKYIRTLRYAGFDITRRKKEGKVWYVLNDTLFHKDLTVQHVQGFEELINTFPKSSFIYQKLMLFIAPKYRMGFWELGFNHRYLTRNTRLESVELLQNLQEAIQNQRFLEFQLFDDATSSSPFKQFWGVPYSIKPFRQKDFVVSCRHPNNRQSFYFKLSDLRHVIEVTQSTLLQDWLKPIDFVLTLNEKIAKTYDSKPNEVLLSSPYESRMRLQVKQEFKYKALSRCLKYQPYAQVFSDVGFEHKLEQFTNLQRRIIQMQEAFLTQNSEKNRDAHQLLSYN
jgi:hypothetical protein